MSSVAVTLKTRGKGASPAAGYLPQLDGLRGLAILAVIVHHFGVHPPPLLDWGPVGPSVFFMLSGFLITRSLLKMQAGSARGFMPVTNELISFHLRRMVRLMPVLYVLLFIGWFFGLDEYHRGWVWHVGLMTNIFMTVHQDWAGSLSHLWSLSVQEQFYILWPLVLLVPRVVFPHVMIITGLLAVIFRMESIAAGASPFFRWFLLPASLDFFATGAFVAWLFDSGRWERLPKKVPSWLVAVVAVLCLAISRAMRFLPLDNPLVGVIELFECVFFGWLLVRLIESPKGAVSRMLCFRPLMYVGKISYGIFIFHALLNVTLSPYLDSIGLTLSAHPLPRILVLSLCTIAVATLSWNILEQPLNAMVRENSKESGDTLGAAWRGICQACVNLGVSARLALHH